MESGVLPTIPSHLSPECSDFLGCCFKLYVYGDMSVIIRDPKARSTTLELLQHPWIRDVPVPVVLHDMSPSPSITSMQPTQGQTTAPGMLSPMTGELTRFSSPLRASGPIKLDPPVEEAMVEIENEWEISFTALTADVRIYTSKTGDMYHGLYVGTDVSIKRVPMAPEPAERFSESLLLQSPDVETRGRAYMHMNLKDITREFAAMLGARHPNIVQFLGTYDVHARCHG